MSDPAPIEPNPRPHISLVSAGSSEPYRRLAEIFHDVLSEQSLDALLERIADTLGELIPYEDVHIYQADESARLLTPALARGEWDTGRREGRHRPRVDAAVRNVELTPLGREERNRDNHEREDPYGNVQNAHKRYGGHGV